MENDKMRKTQKYFVFKIQDIVNNANHTLEEKRAESLCQYIALCKDTYDELRLALDQSKLMRSYESLLEGLDFQLQNHPFRLLKLYEEDFRHLHQLIELNEEERKKQIHNIHRGLVSLKKKMEKENYLDCYIECLKQEATYKYTDTLIECLVSDLLYKGYSMTYIAGWCKNLQGEFIQKDDVNIIFDKLRELAGHASNYKIYIKFKIASVTQASSAKKLIQEQFTIEEKGETDFPEKWMRDGWLLAAKEYQTMDAVKVVDCARKDFNSIKELFDMWQGTQNCIKDDPWYVWVAENKNDFSKIELKSIDDTRMIRYMDDSYKKQMERFLHLKGIPENEDLGTLERILYTLDRAKNYTAQTRFLNFWSALEYILYPFPRFTIIEKARVVVPEVFGLFYLKNKMNIFWSRLCFCMGKSGYKEKYSALDCFIEECREDKDYSTIKFITCLKKEELYSAVLTELSFHAVLERECMELIMLLTEPEKAYKAIQEYYESVRHDLNYIYRLRNQLIHSTKEMDDSIEYISFRLYRYVNSVLSTILYYKEENNLSSITDILNSIDSTYLDYSSKWISNEYKRKKERGTEDKKWTDEEVYRMVRPQYLFLE